MAWTACNVRLRQPGAYLVLNPRLARNVESENESTLKVKMKVGFSLFILLRPSQARVKLVFKP